MPKILIESDFVGKKINNLTIVKFLDREKSIRYVFCRCDCGKDKKLKLSEILFGSVKSCGCLVKTTLIKRNTSHGLTAHPLYHVWTGIKERCYNPSALSYKNYGGRGILMCAKWLNDFKCFYDWAIKNGWEQGLEIDRTDNNQIYCPDNCRFVTRKDNARNRRSNVIITFNCETHFLTDWAAILKISISGLHDRLKRMSVEQALGTPKQKRYLC